MRPPIKKLLAKLRKSLEVYDNLFSFREVSRDVMADQMFNWKYETSLSHIQVIFRFEKLKGDQILAFKKCIHMFDLLESLEYFPHLSINDDTESIRILTKTHFDTQQPAMVKFGFAILPRGGNTKAFIATVSTIFDYDHLSFISSISCCQETLNLGQN